ncbi:MAG: hypothetical protein FJ316_03305 [SAR202 cluster bacterium]|nr:hypothetical protein [SAR202 cluster bacterium]
MDNNTHGPKIVVIGGGSGSSAVLRGLKRFTPNLSAVVTMFDSGGSSGLLQSEFGYPPLGDLRQCLLGLCEDHVETQSCWGSGSARRAVSRATAWATCCWAHHYWP